MRKPDSFARLIASEITTNCERHLAGEILRPEWDAEQRRLWALAAEHMCMTLVMTLVAPSLIRHQRSA